MNPSNIQQKEMLSAAPPSEVRRLFYDRLQSIKQRIIEELSHTDFQPVAYLLDGHNARIFALFVQHTINRGRRYPAQVGEGIDRKITF